MIASRSRHRRATRSARSRPTERALSSICIPPPAAPTGIDYLRLVEARHTAELAEKLRYADLPPNTTADPFTDHAQVPGQLDLTQLPELADPDPDQTGEAR